jgi:hypothetical protein
MEEEVKCLAKSSRLYAVEAGQWIETPHSPHCATSSVTPEEIDFVTYLVGEVLYIEIIGNHPAGIPHDLYKFDTNFRHVGSFLSPGC